MTVAKKPSALTRRAVELPYGRTSSDEAAQATQGGDGAEAPGVVDESFVEALAELPGLSPRLARTLAVQYRTLDGLSAASETELRAVPGIGPRLAETLQAFTKSTRPTMFGLDLTAPPCDQGGFATAKISRKAHRLLDDVIYFARRTHDVQLEKQVLLGKIIEAFVEANLAELEEHGWTRAP